MPRPPASPADPDLAAALAGVAPLAAGGPSRVRVRCPRRALPARCSAAAEPELSAPVNGWIEGRSGGTSERELRRAGGPDSPVEAVLDLHGLDREAAGLRLGRFLDESARRGRRVVLVVTGKGRRSPAGSVLRAALPGWLAAPPVARRVRGFVTARPAHGGTGAVYVLLAPERPPGRARGRLL